MEDEKEWAFERWSPPHGIYHRGGAGGAAWERRWRTYGAQLYLTPGVLRDMYNNKNFS